MMIFTKMTLPVVTTPLNVFATVTPLPLVTTKTSEVPGLIPIIVRKYSFVSYISLM